MMLFIWDASALAKRYAAETGRDVASYLLRRLNSGILDVTAFTAAVSSLQSVALLLTNQTGTNGVLTSFSASTLTTSDEPILLLRSSRAMWRPGRQTTHWETK